MLDVFPLGCEDLEFDEHGREDLDSIILITLKIIKEDINASGISDIIINYYSYDYKWWITIGFSKQHDLNCYRLIGNIEEGTMNIFEDIGALSVANIRFTLTTEIYG